MPCLRSKPHGRGRVLPGSAARYCVSSGYSCVCCSQLKQRRANETDSGSGVPDLTLAQLVFLIRSSVCAEPIRQ